MRSAFRNQFDPPEIFPAFLLNSIPTFGGGKAIDTEHNGVNLHWSEPRILHFGNDCSTTNWWNHHPLHRRDNATIEKCYFRFTRLTNQLQFTIYHTNRMANQDEFGRVRRHSDISYDSDFFQCNSSTLDRDRRG